MSLFRKYWVIFLIFGMQSATWAQSALRDPTLPPPEVLSASGLDVSSVVGVNQQLAGKPTVQLMLVGPSRKYAVIDGQILKPGAQVDQWRVANITAKGVVMQSDSGSQTISAYPSVQKKVIATGAVAPRSKHKNP